MKKTETRKFIFKIELKSWEIAYAYSYLEFSQFILANYWGIKRIEKVLD